MADILYHVVLDGRRLGPYDRRTIVGMRVRKTLTSRHQLEASDGARLTVAELLHGTLPLTPPAPAEPASPAGDHGGSPMVLPGHAADLLDVQGPAYPMPAFRGEVEVRVQKKALRLAGRHRDALAWKQDRVKIPLHDIIHARLQDSVVELGVREPSGEGVQRLRLELRTPEAARALVEGLPHTVPWPGSEPLAAPGPRARRKAGRGLWMAAFALLALAVAVCAIQARAAYNASASPNGTNTTASAFPSRIMAATRSGSC
ncbi:hypothetical protein [Ramlibacter alkalitolerans]|uniref:DUF4115 domain-containing protein n=1 Tax=Ramlibacter alkalitolerans TaxID=2039631 RepID=A0ABS1JX42_9BURK|nr:hypothetical protein [Ramlibacter alkalitolerans]MBL0428085.1 hypothetical protein [Ramlibacter alkalitolerans]